MCYLSLRLWVQELCYCLRLQRYPDRNHGRWKLRRQNGPNFTWHLLAFSSILPEWLMAKMGKMYRGKPLPFKTRRELLATVKPQQRKYLRKDNGDLPDAWGSLGQEEPTTQLPVLSKIDSN
jgi:hypothetical protein